MIGGLRDRLGDALFLRVAGPDGERHRDRIHLTPGPRWFDPASPIGRVHGDASMFIGGIRAILLQTLHPAAMTAVAEHSGYRGDMWGRLARTSRFIAVTTFGTADDAQRAVDAVRGRSTSGSPAPCPTGRRTPPPTRTCCCGCTSPRSTASCSPTRPTAAGRSTRPDATSTSPRPPRSPAGSASSTRPPPRPSWPRRSRRSGPSSRPPTTPATRSAYLLWKPELPLPLRPAYGVLMAAAIGLMPRWTRLPLRLPSTPVTDATVVRALGARRHPHHPLGDVPAPSRHREFIEEGRPYRNSGMNGRSISRTVVGVKH